eukprot:RCo023215
MFLLEDLLTHPLQLQAGEVPDRRGLRRVGEVLLNARKLAHREPSLDHPDHILLRHPDLIGGHQVDGDLREDLQPVHLAVHRAAVEEVPHQRQVDRLAAPVELLQKAELVQELLRGVLVAAIPSVEEGWGWHPGLLRERGDRPLHQPAHPLQLAADDKHAAAHAVSSEHSDGVSDALLLVEGGGAAVEVVDLDGVELRGVTEAFLGASGVLHEEQVRCDILVSDFEFGGVAAVTDSLFQGPRLLIEVDLLLQAEVVHHGHGATREGRARPGTPVRSCGTTAGHVLPANRVQSVWVQVLGQSTGGVGVGVGVGGKVPKDCEN